MNKWVFLFAIICACSAHAAEDALAGEKKSIVCSACHGPKGQSTNPIWPNLAAQHPRYIIKQLQDYQKQIRVSPIMAPMTAGLSPQDMADLAAFYKNQPAARATSPSRSLKQGEQLYRGGNFEKHITACIACHGPDGRGNGQAGFPSLAGQHPEYFIQQMQQFKDGQRHNDLNAIMQDIAKRMSEEDITAVAYYIAGLPNSK